MKKHLAIFKKGIGELILSGVKKVESRFSVRKLSPFGQISREDIVYIKPVGGEIIGQFRVKKVFFFEGLNADDLRILRETYENELVVGESYWEVHKTAKYGSLIFIGQVTPFITSPVKLIKKDLRGWVVLYT